MSDRKSPADIITDLMIPGIDLRWRTESLRYGENPHQGAFVAIPEDCPGPLGATELQGKEMSFNNWLDADAADRTVREFADAPTVAIIKHQNPCGVATAETLIEAYQRAYDCDQMSAFGGIVALNGRVDLETAKNISGIFTEIVLAPTYTQEALDVFAEKPNLRVLKTPVERPEARAELRPIGGAYLVQETDQISERPTDFEVVTSRAPSERELTDLWFAWRVAAQVKSNAIVLATGRRTVGIGAGQPNRLQSVRLAVEQAGEQADGACLASDAFFPFADGPQGAIDAGVTAIIQPGGSQRDDEVIAAAERHGLAMVLTGRRHFRH